MLNSSLPSPPTPICADSLLLESWRNAKTLQIGAADSVKRLKLISAETPTDWFSEKAQGLYEICDHLEAKTTWHPVGA